MKTLVRRGISLLCAAALAVGMVPSAALADSPDESYGGNAADAFAVPVGGDEGVVGDESDGDVGGDREIGGEAEADPDPSEQTLDIIGTVTLETSAQQQAAIQLFSVGNSIQLAAGNHERWIDRVELPAYAKTLYAVLEEASDNDGVKDYLIDDAYFNATAKNDGTFARFGNATALYVARVSSSATAQQISNALAATVAAFDRDHPEVFWLSGSIAMGQIGSNVYLVLTDGARDVRSSAFGSQYAIKKGIYDRDTAARTILSGVPQGATQEAAIRHFNDWLTHNNEYNTNMYEANGEPWECISALMGRTGANGPVCEGYARAFKVLCDYAKIPCVLVDGYASDPAGGRGEPHMWNYVQLSGAWYAVDVTWNDPYTGRSGKVNGGENDRWLLVGGTTNVEGWPFLKSHPVQNQVFDNGIEFVNGPVLSDTAFAKGAPTPIVAIALPTAVAPQKTKLTAAVLSAKAFTFNGKVQKPKVTVKAGGATVHASSYTVKFSSGCKNVGTYTVTVTGKGSYTGTVKATFKIKKPTVKTPVFSSVKSAKKKQLTATWKKVSGKVTGYQVQYALNKKFTKSAKLSTIKLTSKLKKKSKLTKTVTKLKSKKTYYVRVRSYYKIGGKTFYSSWSKVKKVRVK